MPILKARGKGIDLRDVVGPLEPSPMLEIPKEVCDAVWSALANAHIFVDQSDKEPKLRDKLAYALDALEDAMNDAEATEP